MGCSSACNLTLGKKLQGSLFTWIWPCGDEIWNWAHCKEVKKVQQPNSTLVDSRGVCSADIWGRSEFKSQIWAITRKRAILHLWTTEEVKESGTWQAGDSPGCPSLPTAWWLGWEWLWFDSINQCYYLTCYFQRVTPQIYRCKWLITAQPSETLSPRVPSAMVKTLHLKSIIKAEFCFR